MAQNERGFTLLEIIVALMIMGAVFVTMFQIYSGGLRMATQSDRYLTGVILANHKFGELELQNFETETLEGTFAEPAGYHWRLAIEPYDTPVNDAEANIEVVKVRLDVFWRESGGKKSVQLTSLRTSGSTRPASSNTLLSAVGGASGAPTPTGTGINTPAGPGVVPAPPNAPQPATQPGFRFDISGFPVEMPKDNVPIGIDKLP